MLVRIDQLRVDGVGLMAMNRIPHMPCNHFSVYAERVDVKPAHADDKSKGDSNLTIGGDYGMDFVNGRDLQNPHPGVYANDPTLPDMPNEFRHDLPVGQSTPLKHNAKYFIRHGHAQIAGLATLDGPILAGHYIYVSYGEA